MTNLSSLTSRYIRAVAFVVLGIASVSGQSHSQSRTVRVTGIGSTPYEARQDAIRQALQQTMKQLVVASREIKDDEITRDKVISTMNGYVNAFVIVKSFSDGAQISVEADVTVSESRIRSFVESTATGVARTSSDNLLADATREVEARRARSQLFVSLFSDFPSNALSSRIVKLVPNDVDPSKIDVWFEAKYDPAFLKMLKGSVASIQQTNSARGSLSSSAPNQAVICFSRDFGDSIEEPGVLFKRQTSTPGSGTEGGGRTGKSSVLFQRLASLQEAPQATRPSGCVFVGGIDPEAVEIAGGGQGREVSGLFGYGFLSLAQGFGGGGSTAEMSIQNFDKLEAFVTNRNAGIDKVMRGFGIANRISAAVNQTQADTSTEDPSLFCTEDRVIEGAAEQCRLRSRDASLMMVAVSPNPRSLWVWLDTRPRLFHFQLDINAIAQGKSRFIGMPFLSQPHGVVRSLFGSERVLPYASSRALVEQEFNLYSLRNDALDSDELKGKSKKR